MREAFIDKTFSAGSLATIDQANEIIEDYRAQGYLLTLRQLYYQFVSKDLIENTLKSYKRLGAVLNDGRLAGLIDWAAIEDRTRELKTESHWDSPADIILASLRGYRLDKWANQDNYCEVWIEKEALAGVAERICKRLDVPRFACRGYVSQSEQYVAGKRLEELATDQGKKVTIIHLGDHDPSGIDMTRDNLERLAMFSGGAVNVQRIALNMDQIEQYSPPPNPAKLTDSRAVDYISRFGRDSWELDALEPRVLERLIREAVEPLIDSEALRDVWDQEKTDKRRLAAVMDRWPEVCAFLDRDEHRRIDDCDDE